jgi:hypothetical protein
MAREIIMSDGTKCWEGIRGLSEGAVAVFVRTDRQKPRENSFQTESSMVTYLLLPYSMYQSPSEKLTGFQLVKKFPAFYVTSAVTSARHLSLSRGFLFVSQHDTFLQWGVVSTSPNPQAGGPALFGCPRLLIQSIRSQPPYWRPFLHSQPEDAPCRGDRDPLITGSPVRIRKYLSNTERLHLHQSALYHVNSAALAVFYRTEITFAAWFAV